MQSGHGALEGESDHSSSVQAQALPQSDEQPQPSVAVSAQSGASLGGGVNSEKGVQEY